MPGVTETVEADTALAEFKVSSANLNTLFTVLGSVVTCLIGWILFTHNSDAKGSGKQVAAELKAANTESATVLKETNKELSEVLKERARSAREQNWHHCSPENKQVVERDTIIADVHDLYPPWSSVCVSAYWDSGKTIRTGWPVVNCRKCGDDFDHDSMRIAGFFAIRNPV